MQSKGLSRIFSNTTVQKQLSSQGSPKKNSKEFNKSSPWRDFPGKNTEVGCCILLRVIFRTQGSNQRLLCLLRCRQILYLLSHWGRPECRIGCIQQQQRSFGWYITFIYYWFTHTRSLKQRGKKANGWRQSWGFGEIVGIYIKNLG